MAKSWKSGPMHPHSRTHAWPASAADYLSLVSPDSPWVGHPQLARVCRAYAGVQCPWLKSKKWWVYTLKGSPANMGVILAQYASLLPTSIDCFWWVEKPVTRQSLVVNYAGSRLNIQVFHHGMRWHDIFSTATNPGKIAISWMVKKSLRMRFGGLSFVSEVIVSGSKSSTDRTNIWTSTQISLKTVQFNQVEIKLWTYNDYLSFRQSSNRLLQQF